MYLFSVELACRNMPEEYGAGLSTVDMAEAKREELLSMPTHPS